MHKLLVINGLEQSGKSVLAALVEKLGLSFMPWHDDLLERSFRGVYGASDFQAMERTFEEIFDYYSKHKTQRTILGRDDFRQMENPTLDLSLITEDIQDLRARQWKSFVEVWFECNRVAMKGITYKPWNSDPYFHVIFPINSHRFYDHYRRSVDKVYFINIHRSFDSWMNSRVRRYQYIYRDARTKLAGIRQFHPREMVLQFREYENYIKNGNEMLVHFDELFDGNQEKLLRKIADYIDVPYPPLDLKNEQYDIIANLVPFDQMFKRFDDAKDFIGPQLLRVFQEMRTKPKIGRWDDTWARLSFLRRYYFGRVPFKDS